MATLTIRFAGICTHFRDVVPGVPHRVVLPNATALRFGQVDLEWSGDTANYYLTPHFPFLSTGGNPNVLTLTGLMSGGSLQAAVGLQIINAVGQPVSHLSTYDQLTPSIRTYVSNYQYSEEVVTGGRAACYFDVFNGRVSAEKPGVVPRVVIEMETDGPPQLQVTPLRCGAKNAPRATVTLDTDELWVANVEIDKRDDDAPFDYLLHYLTERAGIPRRLMKDTPGMGPAPPSQDAGEIANALNGLAGVIASGGPTAAQLARIRPDDTTASCADSRYP